MHGFCRRAIDYDALIQPNLNALLYAARVARAPYQLSDGPDAVAPTVSRPLALASLPTRLITATITSASRVISAAQAFMDTPPWAGGTPLALSAADGAFDQATEVVNTALDTSAFEPGTPHHLCARSGCDGQLGAGVGGVSRPDAPICRLSSAGRVPLIERLNSDAIHANGRWASSLWIEPTRALGCAPAPSPARRGA